MVGWTTFVAGQHETSVIISTILRVLPQQAIFGQVIILQQAIALGADVWMPACQDRRPRAASDEVVVDVTASSPTDRGSGNANIKEKSAARGSRDVVPPGEWIIRGQSAVGPVSWVWGSNDKP